MRPEIRLDFCITGTIVSPEKITDLLGITPSRTWNIGEQIQKTNLRRKHNGWCLSADIDKGALDLAGPAKALLNLLTPKAPLIREICVQFDMDCEFGYGIYIVDEQPVINFEPDLLSAMAELNAAVDIDIILIARRKDS